MSDLPALVTPESADADVIRRLEHRWQREFGGELLPWDEAWLWAPQNGYAIFEHHPRAPWIEGDSDHWILRRVWLAKDHRRRGLLRGAWPLWGVRYGEFSAPAPNASMQAFLDALMP